MADETKSIKDPYGISNGLHHLSQGLAWGGFWLCVGMIAIAIAI